MSSRGLAAPGSVRDPSSSSPHLPPHLDLLGSPHPLAVPSTPSRHSAGDPSTSLSGPTVPRVPQRHARPLPPALFFRSLTSPAGRREFFEHVRGRPISVRHVSDATVRGEGEPKSAGGVSDGGEEGDERDGESAGSAEADREDVHSGQESGCGVDTTNPEQAATSEAEASSMEDEAEGTSTAEPFA